MEKINEPKPAKLETGDKDLKKVKEKLSKIKIDENFIAERVKQLIEKGYSEEDSKTIADKEAIIKTDNERLAIYQENGNLKDAEDIIQKILIKRERIQKEKNDILRKGSKDENIKSNRQLIREAEDKLRNMSVDMDIVKKEKSDLLGEGYPFDFSEKLSNLNGEIRLLQNKIQIIIENPKIESGMKLKKNLEKKLSNLENERNILLTSKPTKNEIIKNKTTESNEEPVVDEHDESGIEEEVKNSIPNEKIKTEKTSKKMNWGKLNPFSWFKKNKKTEINNEEQKNETLNKIIDEFLFLKKNAGLSDNEVYAIPLYKSKDVPPEFKKNIIKGKNFKGETIYDLRVTGKEINKFLNKHTQTEKSEEEQINNLMDTEENTNPDDIETVLDEKIKKEKEKNEKKKTLYTKEQQKEFFDGLKEKLKNKEITEADFRNAVFKRTEEIHNFEKSSVYKAMDKWDNWGKDGGVGKYAKMAINIAMIAGISSFTVNGMAGLTERVLSRTVMGTAVGTGLGGIMTFLDRLPPEKKSKVQKIIKGSLIGGSAIFAIGTGGILPGLAIGASTAFGYGVSRYYKNWNDKLMRSEKIENLKEISIDLENLDKNTTSMEFKMKKMLKSADRTKIIAKIASTGMAMALSVGTLEVSGLVHDHLNNTSHSETVDGDTNGEHTGDDNTNHEKNQIPEKENGNANTENNNTQKENNEKIEDTKKSYVGEKEIGAVADKGQGAISTIKELKDNLEKTYENVPEKDIPENVKHIIDTDADDLAKEYGLYRPGEEAESANVLSGDKITLDQETGKVEFHQVKTGEDIVLEKGKDYEGDMFDSGKIKTQVENIETKPNGDETSQFEKEYPQTSPKDEFYSQRYSEENSDKFMGRDSEPGIDQNSNIIIDGEEVKAPEISEKELVETKKLAESYGIDSERYRGETESEYLDRMKNEIAEEKEALRQELASGEKMSLDKTLKAVHGEKVEIEKLRELKEITKGYEGAIGQPSLRDIMEKIKEQGLKAIITKDIGETPTAAHVSVNEKMHLIEKSLGGQKGYNYEFAQKLPNGDVKILHIKLFRE